MFNPFQTPRSHMTSSNDFQSVPSSPPKTPPLRRQRQNSDSNNQQRTDENLNQSNLFFTSFGPIPSEKTSYQSKFQTVNEQNCDPSKLKPVESGNKGLKSIGSLPRSNSRLAIHNGNEQNSNPFIGSQNNTLARPPLPQNSRNKSENPSFGQNQLSPSLFNQSGTNLHSSQSKQIFITPQDKQQQNPIIRQPVVEQQPQSSIIKSPQPHTLKNENQKRNQQPDSANKKTASFVNVSNQTQLQYPNAQSNTIQIDKKSSKQISFYNQPAPSSNPQLSPQTMPPLNFGPPDSSVPLILPLDQSPNWIRYMSRQINNPPPPINVTPFDAIKDPELRQIAYLEMGLQIHRLQASNMQAIKRLKQSGKFLEEMLEEKIRYCQLPHLHYRDSSEVLAERIRENQPKPEPVVNFRRYENRQDQPDRSYEMELRKRPPPQPKIIFYKTNMSEERKKYVEQYIRLFDEGVKRRRQQEMNKQLQQERRWRPSTVKESDSAYKDYQLRSSYSKFSELERVSSTKSIYYHQSPSHKKSSTVNQLSSYQILQSSRKRPSSYQRSSYKFKENSQSGKSLVHKRDPLKSRKQLFSQQKQVEKNQQKQPQNRHKVLLPPLHSRPPLPPSRQPHPCNIQPLQPHIEPLQPPLTEPSPSTTATNNSSSTLSKPLNPVVSEFKIANHEKPFSKRYLLNVENIFVNKYWWYVQRLWLLWRYGLKFKYEGEVKFEKFQSYDHVNKELVEDIFKKNPSIKHLFQGPYPIMHSLQPDFSSHFDSDSKPVHGSLNLPLHLTLPQGYSYTYSDYSQSKVTGLRIFNSSCKVEFLDFVELGTNTNLKGLIEFNEYGAWIGALELEKECKVTCLRKFDGKVSKGKKVVPVEFDSRTKQVKEVIDQQGYKIVAYVQYNLDYHPQLQQERREARFARNRCIFMLVLFALSFLFGIWLKSMGFEQRSFSNRL